MKSLSSDLHIEQWSASSVQAVPDELWHEVEILYTSYSSSLPAPEQVPRLRWVQLYSAGPDPILNHALFQTSVIFTTASGVHAINMAEYVLTVVLAWFHRFPQALALQQRGQWPSNTERTSVLVSQELRGKLLVSSDMAALADR